MPHATSPSLGLQALILCGPGASLNTFTSNPKDLPKALIPIANRPMVWYALDWCYRMGVNSITLVTPPESEPALQSALKLHPALTSLPSPKPEVLAPADLLQTTGTGQILRLPEVQKCIVSDFLIVPCDIVSELDGSRLLQQWITLNPLSTSTNAKGGLGMFYPTQGREGISHKKDETDFIGTVPLSAPVVPPPAGSLRSDIEKVVITMPTDTLNDKVEEDKEYYKLRPALTNKLGKVKLKTKYRDAHVYIFPKWVKEFIAQNDKFESISEDVLGWWAKATWQNGLAEKLGLNDILAPKRPVRSMESSMVEEDDDTVDPARLSSTKPSISSSSGLLPKSQGMQFASRVGTISSSLKHRHHHHQPPTIPNLLAYVQPPVPASSSSSHPFIRRVDTSAAVLNVSLYLAKQPTTHVLSPESKIHPTAQIGLQSRVSVEDSLVAENVTIGTRAVVKESVIGANCSIGNMVRLTRCLLMDGVVVGDGVHLNGCTIGRRARIEGWKPVEQNTSADATQAGKGKKGETQEEERTKLTECEVAPNYVVEAGTEAKGEKMMIFDTEDLGDFEDDEEGEGVEEEEEDE